MIQFARKLAEEKEEACIGRAGKRGGKGYLTRFASASQSSLRLTSSVTAPQSPLFLRLSLALSLHLDTSALLSLRRAPTLLSLFLHLKLSKSALLSPFLRLSLISLSLLLSMCISLIIMLLSLVPSNSTGRRGGTLDKASSRRWSCSRAF